MPVTITLRGTEARLARDPLLAPRMAQALQQSSFMERFLAKGRMRPLLETMPVYLITAEESPALRGMAQALA